MGLIGFVYSKHRGEDGGIRHVAVVVEEGRGMNLTIFLRRGLLFHRLRCSMMQVCIIHPCWLCSAAHVWQLDFFSVNM